MDIKSFTTNLNAGINEAGETFYGDLVPMGAALTRLRQAIAELKDFTASYTFASPEEEIFFFKELKPDLLSKYYMMKKSFGLLLFDSFRDKRARLENYQHQLRKMQRFVERHHELYHYLLSGETYLDHSYFRRNELNKASISTDTSFSTGYDTRKAKILAFNKFRDLIMSLIRQADTERTDSSAFALRWTDSKVALVEIAYALHASGVINHGSADLKQIVNCLEETFSIDLGNYARVFSEIRIRKSGKTNFLNTLKERLTKTIEEMD